MRYFQGRGGCLRNAFICNCAIVNILNGSLEFIEAEKRPGASRQHDVFWVLEVVLRSPSGRLAAAITGQIRSFGEEHEPHGIIILSAFGIRLGLAEFTQAMGEAGSVSSHLARHEDEPIEHHARADEWDPAQRFFEDNVDVAVHTRSVSIANPPQIQPVSIDLAPD